MVNPDEIAVAIDPLRRNERTVLLQAGREVLRLRDEFLSSEISFLVETTLTGQGELALLERARTVGFKVNLAYVGLPRMEMSRSRVTERVLDGGHDVPLDDIQRRFGRSLANLPIALERADRAYLLDNAGLRHRLVYAVEAGRVKYRASTLPLAGLRRLLGLWRQQGEPRLRSAPRRADPSGETDRDVLEAGLRARFPDLGFQR